jgi:hypothetical protein
MLFLSDQHAWQLAHVHTLKLPCEIDVGKVLPFDDVVKFPRSRPFYLSRCPHPVEQRSLVAPAVIIRAYDSPTAGRSSMSHAEYARRVVVVRVQTL